MEAREVSRPSLPVSLMHTPAVLRDDLLDGLQLEGRKALYVGMVYLRSREGKSWN
jgi:hypothetical protein